MVKLKEEIYGKAKISLNELDEWCRDHSSIPDDMDEAYFLNHQIHTNDEDVANNYYAFTIYIYQIKIRND